MTSLEPALSDFSLVEGNYFAVPCLRTCGAAMNIGFEFEGKTKWFGVWNFGHGDLPAHLAPVTKLIDAIRVARAKLVDVGMVHQVDPQLIREPWTPAPGVQRARDPADVADVPPRRQESGCTSM